MTHLKRSMAALILSGTALSAVANSDYYSRERPLWDLHPYLGIDYESTDYELSADKVDMIGIVGGLQFNDYLGLELHWTQNLDKLGLYTVTGSGSNPTLIADDVKIKNYGIGVTFQADLYERLYAKSYVGINRLDADKLFKEDVGLAKVGLGYQFNPDFAAEVTYNTTFAGSASKQYTDSNGVGFQLKYYF